MDSVIYFPPLCGTTDPFWNPNLTLDTDTPDVTACFQLTAVTWTPAVVLAACGVFYIPFLLLSPSIHKGRRKSTLNIIKLLASCLLVILSVSAFVYISLSNHQPIAAYVAPAVTGSAALFTVWIIHMEFIKFIYSSGVMLLFWTLQLLSCVIQVYSLGVKNLDNTANLSTFSSVTLLLQFPLTCLQFVLVLLKDIPKSTPSARIFQERAGGERQPLLGDQTTSNMNSRLPSPEDSASFLSHISFAWIIQLLVRGWKRPLVFDDLPALRAPDTCDVIQPRFERAWYGRVQQAQPASRLELNERVLSPSLVYAMYRSARGTFLIGGLVRFLSCFSEYINPLMLSLLIDFVKGKDEHMWKGYLLAVAFFWLNIINACFSHNFFRYFYITEMRVRAALTTAVYRKALRLSQSARRSTTVGEIINLMSVDAEKLSQIWFEVHEMWACPLSAIIGIYLLWQVIGISTLGALAVIIFIAPFNGSILVKLEAKYQDKQMTEKDNRIKFIHEILNGIKVLKMYAWEHSFSKLVTAVRGRELRFVRLQAYLTAGTGTSWQNTPFLISLGAFTMYILLQPDHYLDASTAFVSISLINSLQFSIAFMPIVLSIAAQAYVSLKRLTKLLAEEEVLSDAVERKEDSKYAIRIQNGDFTWGGDNSSGHLRRICMEVNPGELVAVVGQVGSGKSSLLSAMLGEMTKLQGDVQLMGSVAYVSQHAWIQNCTLRDNVLFGRPHVDHKYRDIVDACALAPDLKILPAGDLTEIGEKGINLSGGQKQRVSLARAVYQSRDIYLLDDPLSAVDSHVGKHIFEQIVGRNGLLKHKTRVLVTHSLAYLRQVDRIVVMDGGAILESGTCDELVANDGPFAALLRSHAHDQTDDASSDELDEEPQLSGQDEESQNQTGVRPRKRQLSRSKSRQESVLEHKPEPKKDELIKEESADVGSVSLGVVKAYVREMGVAWLVVIGVSYLMFAGGQVWANVWLSEWADDPILNGTAARDQSDFRLTVYGLAGLLQMLGVFGLGIGINMAGLNVSKTMHQQLLNAILRAPMSFFDTTPLGRIINRFSMDIEYLDGEIPQSLRQFAFTTNSVFTTLIIICITMPIVLPFLIPLTLILIFLQRFYIASVRQLKRLDSIRKSPIYSNFDETLAGVPTIRAYHEEGRFIAKCRWLVDERLTAWYPMIMAQNWLGLWLQCTATAVVFLVALFCVVQRDSLSAGQAGLAITFALQLLSTINWVILNASGLEKRIVAAERIQEMSRTPSEAAWEVEQCKPSPDWPSEGRVVFTDYKVRYRDGLDLVLKGISFNVEPAEKVAIVGRTGAGKSSITLSLFRILEAAGGSITIDGVRVSDIGLHDLRSRLTIIPQDPVIFSGTLRRNLDPFSTYGDDVIWSCLEQAHLKQFVTSLKEGLDYECGEGGSALSVGQRQLLCLARAMLRRSRILILDEATAAVDLETDKLIQNTIQTHFKDCTVLTIAHRLNTILDYDRVMVLDQGEIKEFDSPASLLADERTLFHSMATDAGCL